MKDRNGENIELLSKVLASIADGMFDTLDPTLGNATEVLAIVDELLPEDKVKCVPIEKGFPFIIDASRVVVVEPLIAQLVACVTDVDVQKLIDEAYLRLNTAVTQPKKRSIKGKSTSSKPAKVNLAAGMDM